PEILRVYNLQGFRRRLDTVNTTITVFRVNVAQTELENLETPSSEYILRRVHTVGKYWPNPGQISEDDIQVLITAE
ncbi:hypothetical protein FRC11_000181, partial [Ceratobasidium sp. 423]